MCILSRPVDHVAATKIFARMTAPDRQLIVYEMTLAAMEDVAMILPLPVPVGSFEDAVRFRSLEAYPQFFRCMEAAFPKEEAPRAQSAGRAATMRLAPLEVHRVGAFIASFVPTAGDFDRLDPRFRMPTAVFASVPEYLDWGFAVFQLARASGKVRIHPMALEFPTRRIDALFFPTLHVHDGDVHPSAEFDHVLYSQGAGPSDTRSAGNLRVYMLDCPAGFIQPEAPAYRREIVGPADNRDHWASLHA